MTKWQWAALWKRVAKMNRWLYHHARDEADRYFMAWIKATVQLDWRGRQARAWKAAAKKWRKEALYTQRLYLQLLRDYTVEGGG